MLTDIFAQRYKDVPIWGAFTEQSRRLIAQGYQLLEQLFPYYISGKVSETGKRNWDVIHSLITRKLGVKELSPLAWAYLGQSNIWSSGTHPMHKVCETWMLQQCSQPIADSFIKERLSLVEIGFRMREQEVRYANAQLPTEIAKAEEFMRTRPQRSGLWIPGSRVDGVRAVNASMNVTWQAAVDELNARFRHAGCNLHYHNGFIQMERDEAVAQQIEGPFWKLLTSAEWTNVDHDMKEAIDLRDTNGRDPAFYAAKALESTVKIISDNKQLSTGMERGASNYIDNLKRGSVIQDWEADALKSFFSKVRNPLGHGPGTGAMPRLNEQQTDWAIEACMTWVKSLIRRM